MSGITESSAGTHATRQPSQQEQAIIDRILANYQLKPSRESYSDYAEDAMFHDPVSIAKGKGSVVKQFNGLPRIFAKSITEHVALLEDSTPDNLKLNLTQKYIFKSPIPFKSEGAEKTVNSLVTLKMNGSGKIQEHHEQWDHTHNKDGDDGFFGKLQEQRKKFDAKMVEATVSSDPDKVS